MKENINVLDEINKGACMGIDAISYIIAKVKDKKFKKLLERQSSEYKKISEDIICDILSISPLTLETHIRNILKRMNINSKHELIYIIRQNNKTIMPYDNK